MKLVAMSGIGALALATFAATPARATTYDFMQLPFRANGLNDLDQIVGGAPTFSYTPLIYDHGTITYLPEISTNRLPGSINLTAINNNGVIVY